MAGVLANRPGILLLLSWQDGETYPPGRRAASDIQLNGLSCAFQSVAILPPSYSLGESTG